MILALETTTNVCSVAYCDDEGKLYERRVEQRGSHSEQLFLFIEELQQAHKFRIPGLDAVLVSEGPGSYTGLRISASAVKGLLFQTKVPLYGINTLASFAMSALNNATGSDTLHSIIDARRVHVYHQKFTVDNEGTLLSDDRVEVIPIEAFESMVRSGDTIVGTGLDRMDKSIRKKANTLGREAITATSLIGLYQQENAAFVTEADPGLFEPKYYTSNQVAT